MRGEIVQPPVDYRADFGPASEHEAADDLADDLSLKGLEAARAEGRALEAQAPELVGQRVGFHLVAEHRGVPAVELELDAIRQAGRDSLEQRLVVRRRVAGRWDEVDAVGIRLDGCGAESRQRAQDRGDDGPPLGGHAIGGGGIVPVPAAEREIAVERVDENLEGLLERTEMRALGGLPRGTGPPLGAHPELAGVGGGGRKDAEGGRGGGPGPTEQEAGM